MITIGTINDIKLLKSQKKLDTEYIDKLEKHFKRLSYILKQDKNAWMYCDLSKDVNFVVLTKEDVENGLTGQKLIRDFYDMFQVHKPGTVDKMILKSGKQMRL